MCCVTTNIDSLICSSVVRYSEGHTRIKALNPVRYRSGRVQKVLIKWIHLNRLLRV